MSAINLISPHKHDLRGHADMNIPKKEHQIGNTTVIIHSPLVSMSSEERAAWYKTEWEKGNPVLKQIADAVDTCYKK